MNICYLIRSFSTRGGTENYVYNMSLTLAALGHNVHIVSTTGKGQWDFKGLEDRINIHQLDLKGRDFKGSWRFEGIFPLFTWRYGRLIKKFLPDLIKKYKIDIVEATDWAADAGDYLSQREAPVCVRLHGYPGFKEDFERGILKKWPKNYFIWNLSRKHILGADLVTGVSKSYINFVRKVWEIKEKNIQTIPIGVDSNIFRPTDIPRKDKVILFAGRLEKSKGIEVLAQAIPLILNKIPDIKFYFAGRDLKCGDGPETWSQRLINDFGKERIIYLGALSTQDLIRQYQSATVCVMPSLYEPGGTVAFEAMACGCPVVASKVGGFEEIIEDRQTGLLTPVGDFTALADDLIELLQKPQLRDQFAQNALQFILKNFELEKIVQKTLDAYTEAIKNFKKPERMKYPT